MASRLTLNPVIRAGVKYPGGASRAERHFLDFVVDGQSLWEGVAKRRDMVSVLCAEFSASNTAKSVNRLLLTEDANCPHDRRSLFVCAECGDLGCGAVTLVVARQSESIVWKDFGFENNYEEIVEVTGYERFGPFTFNAADYETTFRQGLEILKTLKP